MMEGKKEEEEKIKNYVFHFYKEQNAHIKSHIVDGNYKLSAHSDGSKKCNRVANTKPRQKG